MAEQYRKPATLSPSSFWYVDPDKWTRLNQEANNKDQAAEKTANNAKRKLKDISQVAALMETDDGVEPYKACTACKDRPGMRRIPTGKGQTCAWCRKHHLSCDAKRTRLDAEVADSEGENVSPASKKRKVSAAVSVAKLMPTLVTPGVPTSAPVAMMVPVATAAQIPQNTTITTNQIQPWVGQVKAGASTPTDRSTPIPLTAGSSAPSPTRTVKLPERHASTATTPVHRAGTIAGRLEILEKTPMQMRARMNDLIESNEQLNKKYEMLQEHVDTLATRVLAMEQNRRDDAARAQELYDDLRDQLSSVWAQLGFAAPGRGVDEED